MQLNRLVQFHKALGDPTRLRIIAILAGGPKHGQALAGILGLTPPTITHHISKLKEINAVDQKREKNTIYYYLKEKVIENYAGDIIRLIQPGEEVRVKELTGEQMKIVHNYLDKEGKLKTIPSQRKRKLMVLYYIAQSFSPGRKYPEKELNEAIKLFHEDFATIRREFIVNGIMYRDNSIYELNPKELWAAIEQGTN
ncbi:metalloregulator ArsR/SmtB family transcription factor [Bacillus mangrovi]|uniref:Metalloregulator ArsR/SmtB family transcription factor n=1 Tax=Metabacillus mangrovi TaxID=1491830 RepID=A0A7X2S6R5_9BACI|nr:metalloregulator ArsR/SmtB family transcription factor [Metabacillus mangrovi]MTH54293.1 metalloregulator ArsR/SmtB family transcription factor [Metabacillus mangrovi]